MYKADEIKEQIKKAEDTNLAIEERELAASVARVKLLFNLWEQKEIQRNR